MEKSHDCEAKPTWVGRIAVSACGHCETVEWLSEDGPVDPAEAMAAVFGSFDLIDTMEALRAPAPRVLIYAPGSSRKRRHLRALPKHSWLKAAPHLWVSTDGETLLLAPTRPLHFENLTRGA